MPVGLRVNIRNFADLPKAVNATMAKVQRGGTRRAMNKGLTPVLRAARANAPVDKGHLKKSLGKRVRTYRGNGIVWGGVGPRAAYRVKRHGKRTRTGRQSYIQPSKYAHLVESGTVRTRGRRFLGAAFDSKEREFTRIFGENLGRDIEREAAAAARRRAA